MASVDSVRTTPGPTPGVFLFARLLLAFALLVAGCGRQPAADLVILNGPEPGTLDPAGVVTVEELRAVLPLFEGLMRPDPVTARPRAGLAERWAVSPDGLTYTFTLRTNAAWSTGEPITAADVLWSWRRVLEPTNASQYVNLLFPVRGAEAYATGTARDFATVGLAAPDARTFVAELHSPCAFFLELCAFQTLSAVPRAAIERHGDAWVLRDPPFSGAYTLDFWRLNDRLRLRRNPRYWDAANTRNEVVDLLAVTAPATALNLYLAGDADVIWDKPLVPSELMPELRKRPDFHTFPILGAYFIRLNVTRPPLDDARVRRALALALDKRRLVARITTSGEEPADHLVPTVTANLLRGEGQRHDPGEARRLLAEAGFPEGRGFPVLRYLMDSGGGAGRAFERAGVELQEMWRRELGIEVELERREKKAFILTQRALEYDLCRSSWIGDYNDPSTFLDLFLSGGGNNRTGWKNARYDELLRAAAREPDLRRRSELLRDAETLLVRDEAPVIPLWFEAGFHLYRTNELHGIHPNVLDTHPLQAIGRVKR